MLCCFGMAEEVSCGLEDFATLSASVFVILLICEANPSMSLILWTLRMGVVVTQINERASASSRLIALEIQISKCFKATDGNTRGGIL